MGSASDFVFYILAAVAVICASGVVMSRNPIYSAFHLVGSMIAIAGLFATLDAYFLAAVQLIVYAGAVMVLFTMVLMLFDLKHEMKTFSKGAVANVFKLASGGIFLGMMLIYIWFTFSNDPGFKPIANDPVKSMEFTRQLSGLLFTKYLFAFEAIGALLLMIAVGAVTLSRISGGTHADH